MIWIVYNILFAIAFVFLLPKFLYRMWRRGGYLSGIRQRLGYFSPGQLARMRETRRLWIHAVSVGEVKVALRFIEEFRSQLPDAAFVLSTTTSTGHALAEGRIDARDVLVWFPVDFPRVVRRSLEAADPVGLILVERELWPNLIRLAKERGIPVALVNGRISQASADRYAHVGMFFRRGVNCIDLLCMQDDADRQRLLGLGTEPQRVTVTGSAKYDVAARDEDAEGNARAVLGAVGFGADDMLLVGGSTWPGEEEALLTIFEDLKGRHENLRLVLVPRHFERRKSVEREIQKHGFRYVNRSTVDPGASSESGEVPDVLLVDTTGEIMGFYACATAIFVGKSLTSHGGQNIIEPALYHKAIVVGPNMENFMGIVSDFLSDAALVQVTDSVGLQSELERLLSDEEARSTLGRRAGALVERQRGAVAETVAQVRRLLIPSS